MNDATAITLGVIYTAGFSFTLVSFLNVRCKNVTQIQVFFASLVGATFWPILACCMYVVDVLEEVRHSHKEYDNDSRRINN